MLLLDAFPNVSMVTKERVDRKEYTMYYRGLRSDDAAVMMAALASPDRNHPVAFVDN